METYSIIIRIFVTFVLGLVFGLNRQLFHKPVGFGTFTFVALGSSGLAITAIELNSENPLPLLGAIVTGVGFLGAGALIKTHTDKIFGFTTAASIWIFAIIGLVIGAGHYLIALIMYSLVWVVITIDKFLERNGIGSYQKKIALKTKIPLNESTLIQLMGKAKYKIVCIDFNKTDGLYCMVILVERWQKSIYEIQDHLYNHDNIVSFTIE